MNRTLHLAAVYWAGVFALAFGLGIGRTLWLAPQIGAFGAVLCEVPLVLAASWWWARRLLQRRSLPSRTSAFAMGAIAFALLIVAEVALSVLAFGISASEWAASLAAPVGALGLAGQLGFALMPGLVWEAEPTC